MKKLFIELCVTSLLEKLTGLTMVPEDLDLRISGTRLLAGEAVKMPIYPERITNNTALYRLASRDDTIVTDGSIEDILLAMPEGIVFIGDCDRVASLVEHFKVGNDGFVAEDVNAEGYRQGYWTTSDTGMLKEIIAYLKAGPAKPDTDDESDASDDADPADDDRGGHPDGDSFDCGCQARSLEELFQMVTDSDDGDIEVDDGVV